MCDTGYSIRRLVDDLRDLKKGGKPERAMLDVVPDLAKRLVLAKHAWLRPEMCDPNAVQGDRLGVYPLHEEPDHSLAIFVVSWLPGDETPPHDHGTWAVIAGLEGRETNHWWRRLDDGSVPGFAKVERAGARPIDPASIVAMPGDTIHSLHNDSGAASVTLHLYGRNVDYTDRRKFDPVLNTTAPYKIGARLREAVSR